MSQTVEHLLTHMSKYKELKPHVILTIRIQEENSCR